VTSPPVSRFLPTRGITLTLLVAASAAGVMLSAAGSYAVRAVTAVVAAGVFIQAARARDERFTTNCFSAAALLVGALAGVAAVGQLALTGSPAETGSLIDILYLCKGPIAIAALITFPSRPGGRMRTLADGAVAAGSMWLIAQVILIEGQRIGAGLTDAARTTTTARVLLPVFVVAVMFSALARTTEAARPFLLRAGSGLVLLALTDVAMAMVLRHGGQPPNNWIAALNQIGLAILLIAAITSLTPRDGEVPDPRTSLPGRSTLEAVMPYVPLLGALGVAVWNYAMGAVVTREQTPPVLVIAVGVVLRHVSALRDHSVLVAELEARERAARAEALRDPLTGLANRTAFIDHLAGTLTDPAAHPVAVALLDLNNFKDINDTHGHDTGDLLLQRCAERLVAVTPTGGIVARLGGDEFALCQPGAVDGGQGLAASVMKAFDRPLDIGQRRFPVQPSVGVVVDERSAGHADADDAMHLLAHADVAMYQAKAGKDTRASTGVVLTGAARTRAAALIRLREEISQPDLEQFNVLYQPVVDLNTGAIRGVEALIRWRHPELGNISPVEFIPLAEQVGSVGVLGEYVLATAAADLFAWQTVAPAYRLSLGVNLSPRQLVDKALPARFLHLIAVHGLRPDQLMLEITETALVDDLDSAVELVAEFRAAGMSVAVDDFGTGYSSLRYLRRFAADVVKIDREFVQAVVGEPRTAALVKSVVDMAVALDLDTVAEGIETLEQLQEIQALGCRHGQGYLFSRPVEAGAITELLTTGHTYPVGTGSTACRTAPLPRQTDRQATPVSAE
jgi:diguanylate cyclase (GGDEF)-like protein